MEDSDSTVASGGKSIENDNSQCVKVAVNIRPLITSELLVGCTDCINVTRGEPQVQLGSHAFTFDYVFGSTGCPSCKIFDICVSPLVEALFNGYNATVLAYGQTGSGKTYTMGTNYTAEQHADGIIPKVMETIFDKVEALKDNTEFLIRVSFIEIFKEEVFDLLDSNMIISSRNEGSSFVKSSVLPKVPIQIRETVSGGITLSGVTESEVQSKEEMAGYLARGALARATGSTNMNSQSSRSHAIFTISLQQKKILNSPDSGSRVSDLSECILGAKLHLVDLAGSERAKRTGADGLRLKEGIHINKGLLALGNVISALGDDRKRKEGGHVPYRDSKLTRLLQDSLGGNSKTIMIACVSPADTNAEETLNTLKYANRARNIQNKPIINRDPMAAQLQLMRSQLEQLHAEVLFYRGEGTSFDELQILKHKISVLEASNVELRRELQQTKSACEHFAQAAIDSQVEKDKLILKIESARSGKSWEAIDDGDEQQNTSLVQDYVTKIQELEAQLQQLRSTNCTFRNGIMHVDLGDDGLSCNDVLSANLKYEFDDEEKEQEHSSLQDKLDKELQELDKQLEQKEAEIKRFTNTDTAVLKQHYEKKLLELEQEKKALQQEIENLRMNLESISSSDENAVKLKENYVQKLSVLEAQVAELKHKQEAQSQLLKQKQRSDDAAKRLQDEIQRIKAQKVQLQNKIKQESEQFRAWKVLREKEVLQLRKEGRRNEYEMHKLLALNQRQKMVLQRKTEEATLAAKRLKELLEAKKSRFGTGNNASIQTIIQSIENELEVMVRVDEVRAKYLRHMEERSALAKEVAQLKDEALAIKDKKIGSCTFAMSPGARSSRIFVLENMLKTSSRTLVDLASQLSAAADSEGSFNVKGRWNQIRSLSDAKTLLNHLFDLVSSSRCQLRDAQLVSIEKDNVIKELKDKVLELSGIIRKLRANGGDFQANGGLKQQDEKKKINKKSVEQTILADDLSDMDTTDSDLSESSDPEWVHSNRRFFRHPLGRKRARKHDASKMVSLSPEERIEASSTSHAGCSCSKYSSCKRNCECRDAGASCGSACGCIPTKCTNKGIIYVEDGVKELNKKDEDERFNVITVTSGSEMSSYRDKSDLELDRDLVSHGTKLLQSALKDNSTVDKTRGEAQTRKALGDIGNTAVKERQMPQKQRKKWGKKSVVQIIPTVPLPPLCDKDKGIEAQVSTDESINTDDITLRLPRAMTDAVNAGNLLRERNSNQAQIQSTSTKSSVNTATRSPSQQRVQKDKENSEA